MTDDLFITRAVERTGALSKPIDRHEWLNLAVGTPALTLKQHVPDESLDDDVDYPAFSLLGRFDRPTLFWRNGTIVVKHADDGYLPELRTIAERLGARLLDRNGSEPV